MARMIKIAETKDLMPGNGNVFNVEGERVVVFNVDGHYYAVEDRFIRDGKKSAMLDSPARHYNVKASGNEIHLEL